MAKKIYKNHVKKIDHHHNSSILYASSQYEREGMIASLVFQNINNSKFHPLLFLAWPYRILFLLDCYVG